MTIAISDRPTGELVDMMAQLRDRVAVLKGEYEMAVSRPLEAIARLESELTSRLAREGGTSFKGHNYTFGIRDTKVYNIGDPVAWTDFILKSQDLSYYGKTIIKSAVEEYEKIHGDLPPGVGCSNKRTTFLKAVKK